MRHFTQFDEKDFAKKLRDWVRHGYEELGDTGGCGLGRTTASVLSHRDFLKNPHKVETIGLIIDISYTESSQDRNRRFYFMDFAQIGFPSTGKVNRVGWDEPQTDPSTIAVLRDQT